MKASLFDQASKALKNHSKRDRWVSVVLCMALVVTGSTFYAFIRPGQAKVYKEKVLVCGEEVHEHTDACYDEDGGLICGKADFVLHTHNDDCYDADGNLVCKLTEFAYHVHDESCYRERDVLVCDHEEPEEEHVHTDDCYADASDAGSTDATGSDADATGATGSDASDADATGATGSDASDAGTTGASDSTTGASDAIGASDAPVGAVCDLPEHVHTADCYPSPDPVEAPAVAAEPVLTCEETEHTHDDSCYTVTTDRQLTCALEEGEEHTHDDSCYTEVETGRELTCTLSEHTHGDSCYTTPEAEPVEPAQPEPTCGLTEHTHDESCNLTAAPGADAEAASDPAPVSDPEPASAPAPVSDPEPEPASAPAEESEPQAEEVGEDDGRKLICGKKAASDIHDEDCYETRQVLTCDYAPQILEFHVHTDGCYDAEGNLTCDYAGQVFPAAHAHTEDCYDAGGNLICGQAPRALVPHVHTEDCRDGDGNLTCGLEEQELTMHVHTQDCYDRHGNLDCPVEAAAMAAYVHTDGCYDEDGNLTCDHQVHIHTADCYNEQGHMTCGYELAVTELHTHTDDCYDAQGNLTCGKLEVSEHVHGKDCFIEITVNPDEAWTCGKLAHTHDKDTCYNSSGELICPLEEHEHTIECRLEPGQEWACGLTAHTHSEDCYGEDGTLTCELPEHQHTEDCLPTTTKDNSVTLGGDAWQCGLTAHTHSDECYDADGNLTCEIPEHVHSVECLLKEGETWACGFEAHTHSEDCYDENGELTCDIPEHEHTEDCLPQEVQPNWLCGKTAHTHDPEVCFDKDGNLTCEREEHVHSDDCLAQPEQDYICGKSEHSHTVSCYDLDGNVICGIEAHEHDETCLPKKPLAWQCGLTAHTHTEDCYDADGNLTCTVPEHTHSDACLDGLDPDWVCGIPAHTHTEDCYDETGELTCGMQEHEHSDACLVAKTVDYKCGEVEHTHGADCYDRDGNLTCELPEHTHTDACLEVEQIMTLDLNAPLTTKDIELPGGIKVSFEISGEIYSPTTPGNTPGGEIETNPEEEESGSDVSDAGQEETGSEIEEDAAGTGTDSVTGETATGEDEQHVTFKSEERVYNSANEFTHEDETGTATEVGDTTEAGDTTEVGDTTTEESTGAGNDTSDSTGDMTGTEDGTVPDGAAWETGVDSETQYPVYRTNLDNGLTIEVVVRPEGDAVYQQFDDKATEEEQQLLNVMTIRVLNENGQVVDTSRGNITATITPTGNVTLDNPNDPASETGESGESAAQGQDVTQDQDGTETADQGETSQQEPGTLSYTLYENSNNTITPMITGSGPMNFAVRNSKAFGVTAANESEPDPIFKVEHYARIDRMKNDDTAKGEGIANTLTDSSVAVEDVKGNVLYYTLPARDSNDGNKGKLFRITTGGEVIYEQDEMELYSAKRIRYKNINVEGKQISYADILPEQDAHYELVELWVLIPPGTKLNDQDMVAYEKEPNNWKVYPNSTYKLSDLKFTNREGTADEDESYILITDDTVLRMIYDQTETKSGFNTDAAFYDYDVSDGKIYKESNVNSEIKTRKDEDDNLIAQESLNPPSNQLYAYVKEQGINDKRNYEGKGTGAKLAFGNNNIPTGLGEEKLGATFINRATSNFGNCSFNITNGLTSEGNLKYTEGVIAPNLFGEGSAIGKTYIPGGELHFNRNGDTYTFTSVTGGATWAENLEYFSLIRDNWNKTKKLNSNNFWPLDVSTDSVDGTYGLPGHDMRFGNTSKYDPNGDGKATDAKWKAFGPTGESGSALPLGDDGKDHNSYFGMNFAVEFTLTQDYLAPLEYLFYGDDDMWVYLVKDANHDGQFDGGEVAAAQLICDIGGVHSSVGEYVNLRNYIDFDKDFVRDTGNEDTLNEHYLPNKYKLIFFYTERGASGSTCWMQFTLPQLSASTVPVSDDNLKELKVTKVVEGSTTKDIDNKDEFKFEITLEGETRNDYPCTWYDANNNPKTEGRDTTKQPDVLSSGDKFYLKAGESVSILYLHKNVSYTIRELSEDKDDGYKMVEEYEFVGLRNEIPGVTVDKTTATVRGKIGESDHSIELKFVNRTMPELPETGSYGTNYYVIFGAFLAVACCGLLVVKLRKRERA